MEIKDYMQSARIESLKYFDDANAISQSFE